MPQTVNQHQTAVAGSELRGFQWSKAATVAALPATGQSGEIVTVTATGEDYQWNAVSSSWVRWYNDGTVLTQNITGAASVNVGGRSAAVLTMTGNVASLAFTGWSTDATRTQRVRVQIRQDATGGRTLTASTIAGTWVETVTAATATAANAVVLHFYAVTMNGGSTVFLEPLGVSYTGSVLRQNVSGATTIDVTGRSAAELMLTGNLTSLSFTGWSTDTTITQRVRVQLSQDTTGGRTFNPLTTVGQWLEIPPTTVSPQAESAVFSFYAITTNGGANVYLEPVGVTYTNACTYVQVAEIAVPAVTAGGTAVISHTFSMVASVELIEVATGRRVLADWRQTPGNAASAVTIDFSSAWPANTYTVRVAGATTNPCQLTISAVAASDWISIPLALNAATTVAPNVTWVGPAGSVQWQWGDSTTGSPSSGVPLTKTFGSAFTGNAVLRYKPSVRITGFSDSSGRWAFDVSALPATLTALNVTSTGASLTGTLATLPSSLTTVAIGGNTLSGDLSTLSPSITSLQITGSNIISGSIGSLPAGLTSFSLGGNNTTTGNIATLPAGLTFYDNRGSNTTTGDIAALPAGLTSYANLGANTTSGNIGSLPAGLTLYQNVGSNTTTGDIAALPAGLTTYINIGSNTTTGDIAALPAGLTTYINQGNNTVAGDISTMPAGITSFDARGATTITATGTYTPAAGLRLFSKFAGWSVAEVNAVLVAIDGLGAAGAGKQINLGGTLPAPTGTGLAAKTNLISRSWTVNTN